MSAAVERLATLSRRVAAEPLQIEPLGHPVDVLAFVNDPVTAEILAALFGATGQGRVQFGGLNAAIQVLQSAPCPQLLVIDIAGLNDPITHLDRLADFCPEGTGVVLVGGARDEKLSAELRAIGIAHYLAKPVEPQELRSAILQAAGIFGNEANAQPGQISAESAPEGSFPTTADPLPYTRPAPPPGPAPDLPQTDSTFVPASTVFAPSASAVVAPSDPFSTPVQHGPGIPPPATTQAVPLQAPPYGQSGEIEPLPRAVDLLAFLTEAQSASVVAAILGSHDSVGRVQPGGINAAIAFLKDNASPKVLLVDISGVTEAMSRVDALAEVCAPGTMVIVTGAANDVALYRELKNAGVFEYLVKPLQPELLKSAVLGAASGGAIRPEADATKPILMVVGTRGGVGASTVAINIAGTLAKQGKKTVLLDLDLQFGSVALTLDIDPGHGLREALDRPERVDSMFLNSSAVKVAENLYVLAAEEAVSEAVPVTSESLITLLHELQRHFDALVIDLPRHVATANWEAIGQAHAVLLVADLSLVGIRDTTRLLTAAKDSVDQAKLKLVISSTGGDRGAKIDRKEFETALNRKADYVLPEDSKSVSTANRAGRTVVDVAGTSKLSIALRDLCTDVIGKTATAPAAKKRSVMSLFTRKVKN